MYSHDSPVHTAEGTDTCTGALLFRVCRCERLQAYAFVLVLVLAEGRRGWCIASLHVPYVAACTAPDTPDKYLHMGLRGNFLKMRHLSTTLAHPSPALLLPFLHQLAKRPVTLFPCIGAPCWMRYSRTGRIIANIRVFVRDRVETRKV